MLIIALLPFPSGSHAVGGHIKGHMAASNVNSAGWLAGKIAEGAPSGKLGELGEASAEGFAIPGEAFMFCPRSALAKSSSCRCVAIDCAQPISFMLDCAGMLKVGSQITLKGSRGKFCGSKKLPSVCNQVLVLPSSTATSVCSSWCTCAQQPGEARAMEHVSCDERQRQSCWAQSGSHWHSVLQGITPSVLPPE